MALKDSDFISKEKHELDYVLKKWGKRATQANRDELSAALDRFNADKSLEPHTRELFYGFAERTGLVARLEAKGEAEALAEAAAAPLTSPRRGERSAEAANKPFPWWLILLAILLVVLLLILFRGCSPARAKETGGGPAGAAMMSVAPAQASPGAMTAAPNLPEPGSAELAELNALSGLPAPGIQVRFEPDSPDKLLAGEEGKLTELIEALAAYTGGRILVTGHAAGIGYPEGEERISRGRAEYVAERLRELGLPPGILLRTLGRGSGFPVADPNPEISRRLSRRVEFSFE